ncbi:Protein of unknown function [Streptomyces sp. DvalAA-14]|uniref:DUF3626 domain-containing protein n=1 Tax=unclassified Streptomyces TaxID=2593676 RepID=UPI00081BA14B|nr:MULTISPECIES: DUF3626 domain-containing protein [unclassified Streptomyces]MYS18875.1 DUF3626 domain-containing protein [Streptomyces sp. SID4948]SCD31001.1 Protein of unknown function [Streptomyces sp. DvalAA-14]
MDADTLPPAGPALLAARASGRPLPSGALAPSHERALRHVEALSSGEPLDTGLRVTLNFHPDRTAGGRTVLSGLADDGRYRSQFVTGTSNGGLTAHPGGDRWRWESRMFGGAYDEAPADERPVYGALDFRRQPVGAAPRFGSAHFRLAAGTLARATFCYPDSCLEPLARGVASRMALIALAEADDRDPRSARYARDALDGYVEAQVHGPVRLDRDVEALVLDPSYRGTAVESAAGRLPCAVEWHTGFRLTVEELRRHPDYRGPEYVELGAAIAEDGLLDPRIIGAAAATGRYDPQGLKKVWHCLARYGRR